MKNFAVYNWRCDKLNDPLHNMTFLFLGHIAAVCCLLLFIPVIRRRNIHPSLSHLILHTIHPSSLQLAFVSLYIHTHTTIKKWNSLKDFTAFCSMAIYQRYFGYKRSLFILQVIWPKLTGICFHPLFFGRRYFAYFYLTGFKI